MQGPEQHKEPLTRKRLLSIVEFRLAKIHEDGQRTGKIVPEALESFKQFQQVLKNCVTDGGQPVQVQLFRALATFRLSLADPNFTGNRDHAQQMVREIEATRNFILGEIAAATDMEPDYQEWLKANS